MFNNRDREKMSDLERAMSRGVSGWTKRIHVLLAMALSVMVLVGCDKKKQNGSRGAGASGIIVGENSKKITEMAPTDVIVSVNGDKLTKAGFDEILNVAQYVFRLKHPESRPGEVRQYVSARARALVPQYVAKQLYLQEASRRGLQATAADVAIMESALAGVAKKEGKSVEQFLKAPGKEVASLRKDVNEQALIRTLRQVEFGDRLVVTEADVMKSKGLIDQYNSMCEATNRLVQAQAEQVCRRLRDGADFAKVADEVSQAQKEPGGLWGSFVRGEIEDAQVRNLAFTLPVGSISDPVDTAEGLIIIKVLERVGLDSPMAAQEATVKLGRIVFRLGEFKKMPDDATIKAELEKRRIESLQRGWLEVLVKNARVEYPNGTNFWGVATQGK